MGFKLFVRYPLRVEVMGPGLLVVIPCGQVAVALSLGPHWPRRALLLAGGPEPGIILHHQISREEVLKL